jgi:hypothetical protein
MVRGRAQGHPPRRTLCPYKMHIARTLTSEFGSNMHAEARRSPGGATYHAPSGLENPTG